VAGAWLRLLSLLLLLFFAIGLSRTSVPAWILAEPPDLAMLVVP
jgi:hypothetical protein